MTKTIVSLLLLLIFPAFVNSQANNESYLISGISIKSYSKCSIHKTSVYQVSDGFVSIKDDHISISVRDRKYELLMILSGNNEYLNGIITERNKSKIVCKGIIKSHPSSQLDIAMIKTYLGFNDHNGNENSFLTSGCLSGQTYELMIDILRQTATLKFQKNGSTIEEIFLKLNGITFR